MNEIVKFRNMMAENGAEVTLEEAEGIFRAAKKIIRSAKKMSLNDMWAMMDADGFSEQEKEDIVRLYQHAKEV